MANRDDGSVGDDEFARRLAEAHDAILAGQRPPVDDSDDRELQDATGLLDLIERVSTETPSFGQPDAPTPIPDHPRYIGRFEVRRILGQGGHGVVLLAFDPSLKREVALKVPRPEVLMTADLRARFEREAEAAAALSHPHIVPVLEFGRAGPVSYIASEYIDGCSLAAWLDKRPQPVDPRAAAELVATLADALQHAHRRGVLHRDLKPANVLLAAADGDLRPRNLAAAARITDFGLAKISGTPGQTQTGAIVGTPAYMSPEQADGQVRAISTAADVYSLGAILYELLTGQPPLQKATVLATLEGVRREPPAPLRSLRADTPRDLEAVCLKCLEKSPSDRYAAASDLADELRRWLDGRPVVARPATRRERFTRWWRRNPLLAGLYSVSTMATIAIIAVSVFAAIRISRARDELAVRNRELRESLDAQTSIILEDLLSRQERLTAAHRDYLIQSLDAYQRLAERDDGDPATQRGVARAYGRVGQIQAKLGRNDEALASLDRAIHLLSRMESATEPASLLMRVRFEGTAARVLKNLGRLSQAEQRARGRLQSARQLVDASPGNADFRQQLASAYGGLANVLRQAGKPGESQAAIREALRIQQQLVSDFPEEPEYAGDLATSWYHVAINDFQQRRIEEAGESAEQAQMLLRPLVSAEADDDAIRSQLAAATMMRATTFAMTGQSAKAETAYEEAIRTLYGLATDFPLNASYQISLMDAHSNFGASLLQADRVDDAQHHLSRANRIAAQLVREFPDELRYRLRRANILFELSRAERAAAPEQALAVAQEGLAELDVVRRGGFSDSLLPRIILAGRFAVGEAHVALQDHQRAAESARQLLDEALSLSECQFAAARLLCQCVGLVDSDDSLETAQQSALKREYRDQAATALTRWLNSDAADPRRIDAAPELRTLLESRAELRGLAEAARSE